VGFSAIGKNNSNILDFAFYSSGLPYADWALDGDKVIPRFEHPAYKDGMNFLKKLWDEKLLDPEFQLLDEPTVKDRVYQGRAGFATEYAFRHVAEFADGTKKVNPKATVGFSIGPIGAKGGGGMAGLPRSTTCVFVTAQSKNQQKAAQWIEFMVSDEGKKLLRLGIEGVHYTEANGKITYNEAERAKDGFAPDGWCHPLTWGSVYWPLYEKYLPEGAPYRDWALRTVDLYTGVPNLFPLMTQTEVDNSNVLDDIYNQAFSDMLTGKVGIEAGIADLGKKWRGQGGDKVLAELNKQHQKQ
jgi:putative aldouronate transport system substrate-binding protein